MTSEAASSNIKDQKENEGGAMHQVTQYNIDKSFRKQTLKITSSMVGLTINFPHILPMRITPMGPPQGISDSIRATDVALAAITSGSCCPSEERTLAVT